MGLSLKLTRNVLNTYLALEGAGAARSARISSLSLRQHHRRWSVQRLGRSDPHRRVADDWLEQRVGDDEVWHAGRVCAWQLRHLVAGLSDVHRRDAQRHQPSCTKRSATPAPTRSSARFARASISAPGIARTRRCRKRNGRSATTTTTSKPPCSSRSILQQQQQTFPQELLPEEQTLDSEAEERRTGSLRLSGRRSAARAAGGPASDAAAAGRRDLARDRAVHRMVPGKKRPPRSTTTTDTPAPGGPRRRPAAPSGSPVAAPEAATETIERTFPAGSYIVRMDQPVQPHRRCAARLSILGAKRSAAQPVRRHRLDHGRTGQRESRARHRYQGAPCADGACQRRCAPRRAA